MKKGLNMITKKIKSYPENIIEALQELGIKSVYDKSKQLIYVCHEGICGDIYTIYSKFGSTIESHTLYDMMVGRAYRQAMQEHLRGLSSKSLRLRFSIDDRTKCVTFYSQLKIPKQADERESIADFCHEIHQNSICQQEGLAVLLEKKERFEQREQSQVHLNYAESR